MALYDYPINTLDGDADVAQGLRGQGAAARQRRVQVRPHAAVHRPRGAPEDATSRRASRCSASRATSSASKSPGHPRRSRTFCSTNYGVTFPLFEKIEVNGEGAPPDLRRARGGRRRRGAHRRHPVELREVPRRPDGEVVAAVQPDGHPRGPRARRRDRTAAAWLRWPPTRAAIFDMDGLLVDSEILWHQAELEILVPLGAQIDADATRATKGMFVGEVVDHYHAARRLGRRHRVDERRRPARSTGSATLVEARGPAPARRVARARAVRGARPASRLASSTPRALIDRTLAHFGLAERVRRSCTPPRTSRSASPIPAVFLTTASTARRRPTRCLAFEDSPAGVRVGGRGADGLRRGARRPTSATTPRSTLATVVLDSLDDLDERLARPRSSRTAARTRTRVATRSGSVARRATRRTMATEHARAISSVRVRRPLRRRARGARSDPGDGARHRRATTTCCPSSRRERWEDDADFTATSLATRPRHRADRRRRPRSPRRSWRSGWTRRASSSDGRVRTDVRDDQLAGLRHPTGLRADGDRDRRGRADNVRARLSAVRPALVELARRPRRTSPTSGELPPRRHVLGVAEQAAHLRRRRVPRRSPGRSRTPPRSRLRSLAGADADAACGELAAHLRAELVAAAPTTTRRAARSGYARWARNFTGADLDLDELYAWGWEDLSRINAADVGARRRARCRARTGSPTSRRPRRRRRAGGLRHRRAARAARGASPQDDRRRARRRALRHRPADPALRRAARPRGLRGRAVLHRAERGPHAARARRGSRRSVGTRFPWWRHASTWYHEAVPGHHLQDATVAARGRPPEPLPATPRPGRAATARGGRCTPSGSWRSSAGSTDPADELGYLEGQALRAARIVVDLGLHLGYAAPERPRRARRARRLLVEAVDARRWPSRCSRSARSPIREVAASEVDRYLAMPGAGDLVQGRASASGSRRARPTRAPGCGGRFDLKAFHAYALRLGPMGLDPFRDELARWDGAG